MVGRALFGFLSVKFVLIATLKAERSVYQQQPSGPCREVRLWCLRHEWHLVTSGCGWAKLTGKSLLFKLVGNSWKYWLIRYAKFVLSSLLGWCVMLAKGDWCHKGRIRASQAEKLEGGYTGQCWKMVGLRSLLLVGMIEGQRLLLVRQHVNFAYHLSTVARWFAFVIGWI